MATAGELIGRVLAEDQALVRAAIRRTIPNTEPRRYLYDLVDAYQARAGKGFRASLCLATCRAFGGRTEDAVDAAVALELLHSAFLVHDDIEDDSKLRRGEPALHRSHGLPLALNTGDGLCALAVMALARCAARQPAEVGAALLAELAHLFRRTVEGQAWELGWIAEGDFSVTEMDYFRMVLGKTCWYSTIHPCRVGALIGTQGRATLDHFVPFGFYLGAAFQVRDDLDNLALDAKRYGKDIGGDIVEGKRTIPLIHLLSRCSPIQREEVTRLISGLGSHTARERIERVVELMTEFGSLSYGRDVADSFARLAMLEAAQAFADAKSREDVDYLSALPLYLCGAVTLAAPPSAA